MGQTTPKEVYQKFFAPPSPGGRDSKKISSKVLREQNLRMNAHIERVQNKRERIDYEMREKESSQCTFKPMTNTARSGSNKRSFRDFYNE